jgi:hypothetical protein
MCICAEKSAADSWKLSLTRTFKTGASMVNRVCAGELRNHGLFLARIRDVRNT